MNRPPHFLAGLLTALIALCFCSGATLAASSVDIAVDPNFPGATISSNFIGLSYEMSLVDAAKNGHHFFTPANQPLIKLFRTLGVKSLRVGGNTAELSTVKIPDSADIDSLFAFARAAKVNVIYTLRLSGDHPEADAQTAKYIMARYRPELACFAIGNEPGKLVKDYAAYREAFRHYEAVITRATNAPDAVFCGPCAMHKNVRWANDFARDFAHDKHVILVTQHEYPGTSGRFSTNAEMSIRACEKLLSTNLLQVYERLYDNFVPAVFASGLRYRLEEANSFSNGGADDASDAFASALWGLDYLYWWAEHGATGINFHTGGYADGAPPHRPMKYAVFWNSPEGFAVRPLGYAIKAFDLGCHGQLVPVDFKSNPDRINLATYGVLADDGDLCVTLINKETVRSREANITIAPGNSCTHGQVIFLTAPYNNITATAGVTLGGASIKDNGSWSGTWTSLAAPLNSGQFSVTVPAASAAIIQFQR
jgi:Glycosyl hydrolase family 79 C-terminal beta domain